MTAASILGTPRRSTLDGVRLEVVDDRVTPVAERDLDGLATGRFSRPTGGVAWSSDSWPDDIEFTGFAFTQFAMPVAAGRNLGLDFAPAPELRSPRTISPLLARSDGRVVLLAPLDRPHEQIVAVTDDGLRWGWHGDLDVVPAGCSTSLGIYAGSSVTEAMAMWGADVDVVPRRRDNPVMTHLSYWTDNGAAYWYRAERGVTIAEGRRRSSASRRPGARRERRRRLRSAGTQ